MYTNSIKNHQIKELEVVFIYYGDRDEIFCMPLFIEIESLEKLVITADKVSETKFQFTNSSLNMLKGLTSLKELKFTNFHMQPSDVSFLEENLKGKNLSFE